MSKPIGIAFIGHGEVSGVHARALWLLDRLQLLPVRLRLVTVAGRDPGRAATAASELGFDSSTGNWRSLADDPAVDVVANLSSESAHRDTSIGMLNSGKHVLCEKPLALSGEDAQLMADVAERSGRTTGCCFVFRSAPAVALARDLSTKLGRPMLFRASYNLDYGLREMVHEPAPGTGVDGELPPAPPGGGVIAGLSHVLDLMEVLVGRARTVTAETVHFPRIGGDHGPRFAIPPHLEDAYTAAIRTDKGALATVGASTHAIGAAGAEFQLHAIGGAIRWRQDDLDHLELFEPRPGDAHLEGSRRLIAADPGDPFAGVWPPKVFSLGWDHLLAHQWLGFLRAVVAGAPSGDGLASFADGARIARLCDAIMESARTGRRVELPEEPALLAPPRRWRVAASPPSQ